MNIKASQILITSFFVIALVISGCKHDRPGLPGSVTVSLVKTTVNTPATGIQDTVTYAYDSLGRQVRSQTDTLVTTYTYGAGSVIMNYALAGENFITTYTTNSLGLATSDSKGNSYTYDPNNYLLSASYTGATKADTTRDSISAGDVAMSVYHEVDPSTNNVITSTYTYLSVADSRSYGLSFLGTPNKNLVQTESITQVLNGSVYTTSYSYSYSFDASGRVIQQVQSSGSATYTTAYTYY